MTESAAGDDVVGGTLDVFRTTGSDVVPPIASSFALDGTIEKAATSTTAVAAITSANQIPEYRWHRHWLDDD